MSPSKKVEPPRPDWRRQSGIDDDLPPLADWPPAEILERWAARREDQKRRRIARRRFTAMVVLASLLVAGVVVLVRSSGKGAAKPHGPTTVTKGAVALSVDLGLRRVVSVVAVPGGGPPVVVAIPTAAQVDITGGTPVTVGEAASTTGLMVAAVQASLDTRVDHFVMLDSTALTNLIGALGGITVQTEAEFSYGSQIIGPGPERLTGGAAYAYLQQALDEDLTGRWEEVLAGIFSAKHGADAWSALVGMSDDLAVVRSLLARAQGAGAIVLELPTAPTLDGGVAVDVKGTADLVARNFGPLSAPLVRVVILNGTKRATVGAEIASLLAPSGFRVVAAQDAVSDSVTQTEIVAGGESFTPQAEKVQALLGVGIVYVDSQPTGIADITIKVGKDFKSG
jgi:LytR cell envelope-related transcriptional attenuator/cell envelope-related transcriptional attenuator-like protein